MFLDGNFPHGKKIKTYIFSSKKLHHMNETQPKTSHTEATGNNEKLFGKYNKEPNHDSDVVANQ